VAQGRIEEFFPYDKDRRLRSDRPSNGNAVL